MLKKGVNKKREIHEILVTVYLVNFLLVVTYIDRFKEDGTGCSRSNDR